MKPDSFGSFVIWVALIVASSVGMARLVGAMAGVIGIGSVVIIAFVFNFDLRAPFRSKPSRVVALWWHCLWKFHRTYSYDGASIGCYDCDRPFWTKRD